jgi:hypothetical protein
MLAVPTLYNLAYLATRFRDLDYAAELYEQLVPYAELFAHTTVAKPVGAHFLGMLGAMLGRPEAGRYFALASAAHAKCDAPLLLAETQCEIARAALPNAQRAEIAALLEGPRATGVAHGASFLIRECEALLRLAASATS